MDDTGDGFLELGMRINQWLGATGISVRAAAKTSGIHRSVIQRHRENQFAAITATNLVRLAYMIGAKTWEDLLGPIPPLVESAPANEADDNEGDSAE